ncbi:hypothetical protein GCM10018987_27120 [Streptomyces cremeus]
MEEEAVSLGADVAELLAGAGIGDVDVAAAVADEHVRTAAYQRVVAAVVASGSRERERAVVDVLLRDPHELGAKTAVVALVDGVARRAGGLGEFRARAEELRVAAGRFRGEGHRAFVRRRIDDWVLWHSVREGRVPTAGELAEATDWMQRLLAGQSTSTAVLALLAASGRTRKVRNVAKGRVAGVRPAGGAGRSNETQRLAEGGPGR